MTPVLCVTHLRKSLQYYEQVLGFDSAWQWSEEEAFSEESKPTFACVNRDDISLFLCENGQGNPGSWICLNVCTLDELQTLYEEYQNAQAFILEEPKDYPWGMREMLIKDLDGNTFRIGCQIE